MSLDARAGGLAEMETWLAKADKLVEASREYYDGERVLRVDNAVPKLKNISQDIKFALKYITRAYKATPAAQRQSTEGVALLQRARAVITFTDGLDAAVVAHEERMRSAKKMCWAFRNQVQFGKEYEPLRNEMSSLARLLARPDEMLPRNKYTAGDFQRYLEVAATIDGVCRQDEWKDVAALCPSDQAGWCVVAADPKSVLKRALDLYLGGGADKVQRHEMRRISGSMNADGWFQFEGPVHWQTHMFPSDGAVDAEAKGDAAMYAVLDAAPGGELGGKAAEQEAAMTELRAKVEQLAPTWKLPPKGESHYGVALAKKALARWHKDAKLIAAFARNDGWTVYKTALDQPERRDHGGYLLFQLPGEKWCQLRFFRISESYVGGKPQKAREAVIGDVRFQSCR